MPLSTVNMLEFYRQLSVLLGGDRSTKVTALRFHSAPGQGLCAEPEKIPVIVFDEAHFLINENFYELADHRQLRHGFRGPRPLYTGRSAAPPGKTAAAHPSAFNQRITLKYHLAPLTQDEPSPMSGINSPWRGAKTRCSIKALLPPSIKTPPAFPGHQLPLRQGHDAAPSKKRNSERRGGLQGYPGL